MLQIEVQIVPERWDEKTEKFIEPKIIKLQLEHSLITISKCESKWSKPFLTKKEKTIEETIDYIKCMTLTQNVKSDVYDHITQSDFQMVLDYINSPMTATTFSQNQQTGGNREIVTSELIYYWMIALNIPIDECQKWHLNRLLTLIRVCEIKNNPGKKMSKKDIYKRQAAINAARRKKH